MGEFFVKNLKIKELEVLPVKVLTTQAPVFYDFPLTDKPLAVRLDSYWYMKKEKFEIYKKSQIIQLYNRELEVHHYGELILNEIIHLIDKGYKLPESSDLIRDIGDSYIFKISDYQPFGIIDETGKILNQRYCRMYEIKLGLVELLVKNNLITPHSLYA